MRAVPQPAKKRDPVGSIVTTIAEKQMLADETTASSAYDAGGPPTQEPLEVDRVYSQMPQHKRDDLQDVFSFLDVHGEGTMLIEQLGLGLRASGIRISEAEVAALQRRIGSDKIDFKEFVAIRQRYEDEDPRLDELEENFAVFDRLGEGTINADMFRHVMLTLGEPLTEADVDEIINDADTLGDGAIDMENFVRLMSSVNVSAGGGY